MKSVKYFAITIFLAIVLFLVPNISNAAVEYTRTIPSNDGSIILNLTGLNLETSGKTYSFALVTKGGSPSKWHQITELSKETAKILLSPATEDIEDVLKVTDTGELYIKEDSTNTNVVEKLEVNLKLPYLQAINYSKGTIWYYIKNTYGIGSTSKTYYQFVKVTDKTLIEKYLNIKNNKKSITELEDSLPNIPNTGYNRSDTPQFSNYDDGLYLLWIKLTGDNCKDIYGCIVHDGLPSATKVSQYITENSTKDSDKTTNKDDSSSSSKKDSSSTKDSNSKSSSNSGDSTTAKGKIPYTGISYSIIIAIVVLIVGGIIAKAKYNDLKNI